MVPTFESNFYILCFESVHFDILCSGQGSIGKHCVNFGHLPGFICVKTVSETGPLTMWLLLSLEISIPFGKASCKICRRRER